MGEGEDEKWLERGRVKWDNGKRGYDYKGGGWRKLKKSKMRATRIIEMLSKIVVVERVKLRQLLRMSRRHRPAACGGWWV